MTDRWRLEIGGAGADPLERLVRQIAAAGAAGIDLVQIRERDLPARALRDLVRRCLDSTAGAPTCLVVNDRLDVALAAGAAGVHLRADSLDAARVRDLAPESFLVGRSVHSLPEALAAAEGPIDYLIAGSVFPTRSKPQDHATIGLAGLTAIVRAVAVPVLAIGGIAPAVVPLVARSGAAGIAAIGLFSPVPGRDDPERHLRARAAEVRRLFDSPPISP